MNFYGAVYFYYVIALLRLKSRLKKVVNSPFLITLITTPFKAKRTLTHWPHHFVPNSNQENEAVAELSAHVIWAFDKIWTWANIYLRSNKAYFNPTEKTGNQPFLEKVSATLFPFWEQCFEWVAFIDLNKPKDTHDSIKFEGGKKWIKFCAFPF